MLLLLLLLLRSCCWSLDWCRAFVVGACFGAGLFAAAAVAAASELLLGPELVQGIVAYGDAAMRSAM